MIERIIDKRNHDLGGGFVVGRVLPFHARRMVGPFIFFDHLGPLELAPGIPRELDVRPHPHIGLSTVTYLYSGQITHRDSLGFHQEIRPGEVNWMVAGSGITHSERLEYARAHGAAAIDTLADRQIATVSGTIRAVTLRPRSTVPALVVELYDGSQTLVLVWLGRRQIRGIEPGAYVRATGRVCIREGVPTIFNPAYELLPRTGR